jgi:hypothetical protein
LSVLSLLFVIHTKAKQVVHGLSIPLGKLGFFLPRTLSRAFTSPGEESARSSIERHRAPSLAVLRERRKRNNSSRAFTLGRAVGRAENSGTVSPRDAEIPSPPRTPPAVAKKRTIRFPDSDPPPLSLDEPSSAGSNDIEARVAAEVAEEGETANEGKGEE